MHIHWQTTIFELIQNDAFSTYYNEISAVILDDCELENMFKGWSSYSGRRHFEILKRCIGRDSSVYAFNVVKNLFTCEAHNELLTTYVNMWYYEPDVDYSEYFNRIKKYINCASIYKKLHI